MGSIAKKGLQQYLIQLQQHPLRTKAITAGVLSAISDIVAQKLTGIQKLQLRRLLLKVLFGCAYLGPFRHFLHLILDKIFKGKKDTSTVAKKVVLEQLTSSPWNNLMFMIYYGVVVEVLASCGVDKSSICTTAVPCDFPQLSCNVLVNIVSPLICFLYMLAFLRYRGIFLNLRALPKAK
ncbi:peroxisomal membrane protein pmp22 [Citrus sinensis]|nr:peroxisomal membrane protein pmp22 [Citrus sinensis]